MKSPKKYIIQIVLLFVIANSSFANWTAIGPESFTGYAAYCNNDYYYVGYNYLGIRQYNIKENKWVDITYNLAPKDILSISEYADKVYISNGTDVCFLDTLNKTWSNVTNGVLLDNTQSISKLVTKENNLFAVALSNNGQNQLYKYDNATWSLVNISNGVISINDINTISVDVIDSEIILSEKNGFHIAHSSDDGITWSILTYMPDGVNPTTAPEIVKIKNGNYYAYSFTEGFVCSLDSGKTWLANLGPEIPLSYHITNIGFAIDQIFIISPMGVNYSDLKLSSWYLNINGLFETDLQTIVFNDKAAFVTSISNVFQISLDELEMTLTDIPQLFYPNNRTYIEPSDIYFNWRNCNGAIGYQIQVATDSDFTNIIINQDNLLENDYYIESLDNADYYYWKVASISADNSHQWSEVFTFGLSSKSAIPDLIYPANGALNVDTSLTFRWSNVRFAESYDFSITTDPEFFSSVNYKSITDTSLKIDGLVRNTTYYWRVNPNSKSEADDMSSIFMFKTFDKLGVDDNNAISIKTEANSIIINNYDNVNPCPIKVYNYLGTEITCNINYYNNTIIVVPENLLKGIYFLYLNGRVYPIGF
jgi:hypothetical protein